MNREDTQFVFIDTPGFHKARTKLGDYMVKIVNDSVTDVDAIALVVEPVPTVGTQESILIEKIKQSKIPSVLAINKIDTVKKEELLAVIAAYSQVHEFNSIVPISARTGENVDLLLDELGKFAQEGPQLFPDDMITDQPEKQIMAEIVREKLLMCLDREIPHGTAVVVTKFSEREDTEIIDVDVKYTVKNPATRA